MARNDSRFGIRIEKTSEFPSSEPIVKRENDAGAEVSHRASAAAIFIGCWLVMTRACRSPVMATAAPATRSVTAPTRAAAVNAAVSLARSRRSLQSATPATNAPAVMNEAAIVWGNVTSTVELVITAQKSVSSARPVTGFRV